MRTYKLKSSSAQVNEGDTFTTTLETTDVITGTTLYYRVVGKGINANDFSSGALKGTLIVGTDGKATLTHSLKADKVTEGSELLTIEVFSDKKMKYRVGTSDAVTISDTSTKAVKGGKDPVTGRTFQASTGGRTIVFQDDVVYETIEGSPDTYADDIIRPLKSIPIGAPPAGSSYVQFQLGSDRMAFSMYGDGRSVNENMQRGVMFGKFSYDNKKRLTSVTLASGGNIAQSDSNPDVLHGGIQKDISSRAYTPEQLFGDNREEAPYIDLTEYSNDGKRKEESGGGLAAIRAFGGGKYFFDGWQNSLFDTSLV